MKKTPKTDELEKFYPKHAMLLASYGITIGLTHLFWWSDGAEQKFRVPVIETKPKKQKAHKEETYKQKEMPLGFLPEIEKVKLELQTAKENFAQLQKQFDELRREYEVLKNK